MDVSSLSVGMDVLISIIFGAGGALGVWFKLKGTVNIQAVEIASLKEELQKVEETHKEDRKQLHKRIDSQKELIEKNRENSDKGLQGITKNMNEMELRIIKAIHEIGK